MFTYYCSNYDKVKTADKKGWWVSFKTESRDHGAVLIPDELVPNGITSNEEALDVLKKVLDEEWENGHFYAYLKDFGYQEEDFSSGLVQEI